jgi:hypothetical protein
MKPVVSSLVALAIAIAPMTAFAKPAHPKTHIKHKAEKADDKAEKIAAKDKSKDKDKADDKSPMVRVKAGKKDGAHLKPAVHHAHNVDLGGPGHKEPKVDGQGAIVPASMRAPLSHNKPAPAGKPAPKASEMPKLPNPNAGKPSKGGAEKGARKPAAQKHETANDANDGETTRDEEFAELVARIRGRKTATAEDDTNDLTRSDDKGEGLMNTPAEKAAKAASSKGMPKGPDGASASKQKAEPCSKQPVEIVRGPEVERFELMKCDGTVAPLAVEHLSVMIRPGGAARPTAPITELAKKPGPELAHGIRRADPRLIERLQNVVDHFSKAGSPAKLLVISGYRPASIGSMHSAGRAIDFRVDGTKNEDVVAFCKTLGDTGCGYYPNSSFVHIDVRDPGAGHVSWIDASGPGETPRYVSAWPPAGASAHQPDNHLEKTSMTRIERLAEEGASLLRARRPVDRDSASEPVDDHPAELPQ